jgi:O-antigen/teichoic acid export membrane protein
MSKAANLAKVSAKGSFHLLWGLVISTVILSVGAIFVARLLGSELYGLYSIAMTAPTLIAIFRDWGINSAMVQCTAHYRAENREDEIRSIFISGLIFETAIGLALSALSFGLSGLIAGNIFNRPEITPLIQIASLSILAGGLSNAATAAFVGIEKMQYNSAMLIAQSVIKTATMIGLVILGLSTLGATMESTIGATIGYTLGMATGGIVGTLLMLSLYRKLPKPTSAKLEIKAYTKTMLTYGLPLSLSSIINSFQTQFYAFLLPIYYVIDNAAIGNFGIATTFVVLITFFATPITTMLFPAFSKLDPQKDKETLKNVFQFSVKYAALLVVPTATIVMSLSQPAVQTLFGNTYDSAPLFLTLLSIGYIYSAFGNLSAGNFINSQGKTTYQLQLTLLAAAIGFPMGYILIMNFGVFGLIVASLTSGLPSLFISLAWIRKHYGLTVDWRSSGRILLSSGVAGGLTYLLVSELKFSGWIELVVGVVFFLAVFSTAVLLTRTINRADVANLRGMVGGLGPLSGVLITVLNLIEKLMTALGT